MVRAIVDGTVIAESDDTVVVEGNHYFPPDSVADDVVRDSPRTTTCPWKGVASYYDLVVDGTTLEEAAWYYPEPSQAAAEIRDHVAFYAAKGVTIEE